MFELKETAKGRTRKLSSCFGLKEMDVQRLSGSHDESESNRFEALQLFDVRIKSTKRETVSCQ
jgi:hypothetical protein